MLARLSKHPCLLASWHMQAERHCVTQYRRDSDTFANSMTDVSVIVLGTLKRNQILYDEALAMRLYAETLRSKYTYTAMNAGKGRYGHSRL